MKYSRKKILDNISDLFPEEINRNIFLTMEEEAQKLVAFVPYAVFPFRDVPKIFKKVCCFNGGDEDWLIVAKQKNLDLAGWTPEWILHTDSCKEPDEYIINDDITIFVGSHA